MPTCPPRWPSPWAGRSPIRACCPRPDCFLPRLPYLPLMAMGSPELAAAVAGAFANEMAAITECSQERHGAVAVGAGPGRRPSIDSSWSTCSVGLARRQAPAPGASAQLGAGDRPGLASRAERLAAHESGAAAWVLHADPTRAGRRAWVLNADSARAASRGRDGRLVAGLGPPRHACTRPAVVPWTRKVRQDDPEGNLLEAGVGPGRRSAATGPPPRPRPRGAPPARTSRRYQPRAGAAAGAGDGADPDRDPRTAVDRQGPPDQDPDDPPADPGQRGVEQAGGRDRQAHDQEDQGSENR